MQAERAHYWHERVKRILLWRNSAWVKCFAPSKHLRFPTFHTSWMKSGMVWMDAKDREAGRPLERAFFLAKISQAAPYFGA
jgi:phage terminase large subunit-like protein